jgi:hypothetical protein
MDQATATLQQRIDQLDRKLPAKQLEQLTSLVRLLGFELKPIKVSKLKPKAGKPILKSKWYKPQSLADLARGVITTASGMRETGWESYKSEYVFTDGGPWPADIAAFYASK